MISPLWAKVLVFISISLLLFFPVRKWYLAMRHFSCSSIYRSFWILNNSFKVIVPVAVCPSAAAVVASAVSESTTPDVVVAAAVVEVELLCDGRLGRDVKDSWVR